LKQVSIFILLLSGFLLQGEGNCFSFNKKSAAPACGYCGNAISGEYIKYKNGSVYHRDCHAIAKRCAICGLLIGKAEKVQSDKAGHTFHGACYKNAPVCEACGEPLVAGQPYRKAKNDAAKWHVTCFENSSFCEITGQYIRPGAATVRIGSEIFLKSEYDKSKKCIVSALPIANHGRYYINPRSKTYLLDKYKPQTRQCYSCGDWLADGYIFEDQFFLCKYCYGNSVKDSPAANLYLKKASGFFKEKGIRIPRNIEIVILAPGQLVAGHKSTDMKGACHSTGTVVWGKDVYEHKVEILYGLNFDRFAATLVHELSHAIIAEEIKYQNVTLQAVPYEEGRCEYAAFRFAQEKGLPDYIVDGFALNRVAEYREGFLYYSRRNPASLKSILTIK